MIYDVGESTGSSEKRGRRSWPCRVARCLGLGSLALAVVVGSYLAVVAIRRELPRQLPPLAGRYAVGRTQLQLTTVRDDPTAPQPAPRETSVWLWYPASVRAGSRSADYAPSIWNRLHLPGPIGFGQGLFDELRTHAAEDAPIAAGKFGLVVLEPGMGFAAPQYQALAESLASVGFLVEGVTPTHSANLSVIDGQAVASTAAGDPVGLGDHRGPGRIEADRLVGLWANDAAVTSTALHTGALATAVTRHLRPGTVYVGHSFGGAAALQACSTDRSCQGAADVDGTQFGPVLHTGVGHPTLLLGSDNSCITGTCARHAEHNTDDLVAARAVLRHTTATATLSDPQRRTPLQLHRLRRLLPCRTPEEVPGHWPADGQRSLEITAAVIAGFALKASTGNTHNLRMPNGFGNPAAYPELTRQPC